MNRLITNICSSDLNRAKNFYIELFDLQVNYDSDWFIHLSSPSNSSLELGIIDKNHDLVPASLRGQPTGMYITIVVDNVDSIYEKAQALSLEIVEPPTLTFYGQKRMLLKDPDGGLIDVSSPHDD